ncbi:sensor histidine kinase [Nonomuraea sp. ZG12]|uniref:sensor histidine kinase n=1 Tax=Nonomuraea sp. ZG12 TaxID=3452207 RepID=UPI003F8AF128
MTHLGSTRYDSAARQVESAVTRTATGVRGVTGLVMAVAAILGAAAPVSVLWLAPLLALELGWTALFLRLAWRRRPLRGWQVAGDVVTTVALCLAQRHLVAAEALEGGASWIAGLVTMSIILAVVAWTPRVAIPAALTVAGAYLVGMRLASPAQDVYGTLVIHLVQIVSIVLLMTLLRRSAASADAFLHSSARAQIALMVERLRREDELRQVSSVHETSLHTLTMVGLGTYDGPSATLRAQAVTDLSALDRLRDRPRADSAPIALDALLEEVAGRATGLEVHRSLIPATVPGDVAERFARAVTEALANIARHAGVREAELVSCHHAGEIRVEVADEGGGFDQDRLPPDRFGVRGSILDTMRSLPNGGAEISSGCQGTKVSLWWRP